MAIYSSAGTLIIVFALLWMINPTKIFAVSFIISLIIFIITMGPLSRMEEELSILMNIFNK